MQTDYQIKILMLFHELEKALGDMYMLFAERFPEHNNLWHRLIKEEQEHAEAVQKLYQLTYQGQALFDEGIIKAEGVQTIIDYVKDACAAEKPGSITALQALTTAHDLEKSLIAKSIFSHFRVSPQFADMLRYLREGSLSHIDLTKNELDKTKKDHTKKKPQSPQ